MFHDAFGNPFGFQFGLFNIMFTLSFVIIFGIFIVIIFSGLKEWNKNNHSPRLSVDAKVIGKREEFSRRRHHNDSMHYHTSTYYYVTFEVESGDRMEFAVTGNEYGMLIEGDTGKLTFQGTRYLGFERMR